MIYDWFNIYNKTVFEAESIPSKELEYEFTGYDIKTILITDGNTFGVVIEGVFLSLGLNEMNPFEFENYACYLDSDNNIWVGILNNED